MTADLPTEEDVLAMLLLWAARPLVRNVDNTAQWQERTAFDAGVALTEDTQIPAAIARRRLTDGLAEWGAAFGYEHAISDSERRLAAERRRDAVVMAAQEWLHVPTLLAHEGLAVAVSVFEAVR